MSALFADQWLWLIFVGVGFLLVIAELVGGIDTGFDLVSIGLAFVLGGLIGWPFGSWPAPMISVTVVSIAYIAFGRRNIKRWVQVRGTKSGVDRLIGRTALVVKPISKYERGRVKIDAVVWRASADEEIEEGIEVAIDGVHGSTLIVSRQGGDQL